MLISAATAIYVRLSSPYGMRIHPVSKKRKHHNGIDLAVPVGTPIRAIAPGIVIRVYREHPINGNAVVITHGNGWTSSYVHLARLDVQKGQPVDYHTLLGFSGGAKGDPGSGTSTGPHLHLTIRAGGKDLDPVPWIHWQNVHLTQ